MRLTYIAIAVAALVSQSAFAEGNKAGADRQAQSGAEQTRPGQASRAQASTGATQQSTAVIKQAQQKLSAAGHDAGPADGVLSTKTQQALKDYQKSKGLDQTGQLDQRTLSALGVNGGAVGATSSSTSAGSVGAGGAKTR